MKELQGLGLRVDLVKDNELEDAENVVTEKGTGGKLEDLDIAPDELGQTVSPDDLDEEDDNITDMPDDDEEDMIDIDENDEDDNNEEEEA